MGGDGGDRQGSTAVCMRLAVRGAPASTTLGLICKVVFGDLLLTVAKQPVIH